MVKNKYFIYDLPWEYGMRQNVKTKKFTIWDSPVWHKSANIPFFALSSRLSKSQDLCQNFTSIFCQFDFVF